MPAIVIKVVVTAVVLTAGVGVVLYVLHQFENPQSEFQTYDELAASGLIEAGWVPRVLPRSAYEIRETHSLHTNRTQIWFR